VAEEDFKEFIISELTNNTQKYVSPEDIKKINKLKKRGQNRSIREKSPVNQGVVKKTRNNFETIIEEDTCHLDDYD
jgi:hypothetical protein